MPHEATSIIELAQQLVRIPSQAGKDSLEPIVSAISSWFSRSDIPWEIISDEKGNILGVLATVDSGRPGPEICLDAPIDTAPIGSEEAWKESPLEGIIRDGKMFGRGAADCKIAVSIFAHIARKLTISGDLQAGRLHVLLDGDEHTGSFGGVKSFIEKLGHRPNFVALGYPGNYGIKVGARGFYRTVVKTFGTDKHSGTRADTTPGNAIVKMAHLVQILSSLPMPKETDEDFSFGPKLSVTGISGGSGFSQIPGICSANVDIRLTPSFGAEEARTIIEKALRDVDELFPTRRASCHEEDASWPAYKIDPNTFYIKTLKEAAECAFSKPVYYVVSGPSNIGNYLASFNIPATCGFGVSYDFQHAANEYIELDSVPAVYATYYQACLAWCSSIKKHNPHNNFPVKNRSSMTPKKPGILTNFQ